ncbi:cupin domain-containing protein [Pantanalinema rosaneae CENA516]|uniref:cupin domain-containing protein n=1 Tax=Pantanalinema rosaneae TaxID=1620701 RepID=UPI003D6F36EB
MAILQLADQQVHGLTSISPVLEAINIRLEYHPIQLLPAAKDLLERDVLELEHRQNLLELYQDHLAAIVPDGEYAWCDLLVLHPGSPNLQTIEHNYGRYHTHADPEVLYVLAGSAIFGFTHPDQGSQLQLRLEAGDFLHIPSHVEHWFSLTALLQFKAARYFVNTNSWMAHYTNTVMDESN